MSTENLAHQIGELKGTVKTMQSSLNAWMELWARQDAAATSSRRDMYQRIERLSASVTGMDATLSSVKEDVQELKTEIDTRIMPTITSYNLALAQRAGMWLMGKFFWAAVVAICTVAGFVVHEGIQYISGGKLPFMHP